MSRRARVAALGVALALAPGAPAIADGFSAETASFTVKVGGERNRYRIFGTYVLPGERLSLEVIEADAGAEFELRVPSGTPRRISRRGWSWRVPEEPGLYPAEIRHHSPEEVMQLNVFVLRPYRRGQGEHLEGYRIGSYPLEALRGLAVYRPPTGFVRVTADNLAARVSPHFTLGQFVCKQQGDYPKYLILRERLLLKLEYLLGLVNAKGHRSDSFHVMSGFRTPFYNKAIGNVRYSRHVWGGAADIFIDENPRDGIMDDLNGDGRVDRRDAEYLFRLFESQSGTQTWEPFVGGMGIYGTTASHGPFVHVDVRGFRARW